MDTSGVLITKRSSRSKLTHGGRLTTSECIAASFIVGATHHLLMESPLIQLVPAWAVPAKAKAGAPSALNDDGGAPDRQGRGIHRLEGPG